MLIPNPNSCTVMRRGRAERDDEKAADEEDDEPPSQRRALNDEDVVTECSNEGCVKDAAADGGPDIMFHKSKDEERIMPCPKFFEHFRIFNTDMQIVDPNMICQQIGQSWSEGYDIIQAAIVEGLGRDILDVNNATPYARRVIRTMFVAIGVYETLRHANPAPDDLNQRSADPNELMGILENIDWVVRPMHTINIPGGLKGVLTNAFYTLLFRSTPNSFVNHMSSIMDSLETILSHSADEGRVTDIQAKDFRRKITILRSVMMITDRSVATILNPPELYIDPEDADLSKDLMIDYVINYLTNKGTVITDSEIPARVMVALPIFEEHGVFTFTYTQPLTIGEALTTLKVHRSVSRIYAKQMENISRELSTFHEQSVIPRSPNDFVAQQRYIAFKNGLYCCITGIFYYQREQMDERMPKNWTHYLEEIEIINGSRTRAMTYLDKECRYYEFLSFLIGGEFLRRKFEEYSRARDENENHFTSQWNGNDTVFGSPYGEPAFDELKDMNEEELERLKLEQKAYIDRKLETFDEWVFDKRYLKRLDTLDIRCRAPQKVLGDQQVPRDAYRRWLSVVGRCLTGILGQQTRAKNGAHRYMEKALKHPVEDRMEYAAALIGVASCGKSQLLSMLLRYVDQHYVGVLSDHERPIDNFSTIRDKALVIASDYQTDVKKPSIPSGDLKKVISNEPVVNHRLHQVSRIIHFLCMFVFASNKALPFSETNGDISRRIFQFYMKYKIPRDARKFAHDDDRNVMRVFDEEDIDGYCLASTWEHKRILLNVGTTSVYEPPDADFEIPQFLLDTQADFIRSQDSLTAFLLSLGSRFGWGHANLGQTVDRDQFIELYRKYCDHYKCEMKKDTMVDADLVRNYQVVLNSGPPPTYVNIRMNFEETADANEVILG